MVYVDNTTDLQEVWIPKNEDTYAIPTRGDYEEGYKDGVRDQKAKVSGITITDNGTYTNPNGYSPVVVNVPTSEPNLVDFVTTQYEADVTYQTPQGYDGMRTARINATPYGNTRYNEGKQEIQNGLVDKTVTSNGTYRPSVGQYGFKKVIVNVPTEDRYEEGVADGKAAQKALMEEITVTQNGTYAREDGYRSISVNVQSGGNIQAEKGVQTSDALVEITPDSGYDGMAKVIVDASPYGVAQYDLGRARQKTEDDDSLEEITIEENGEYIPSYGYKKVTVNIDSYCEPSRVEDSRSVVMTATTMTIVPSKGYRVNKTDFVGKDPANSSPIYDNTGKGIIYAEWWGEVCLGDEWNNEPLVHDRWYSYTQNGTSIVVKNTDNGWYLGVISGSFSINSNWASIIHNDADVFEGMGEVIVDASTVYNNGFESGKSYALDYSNKPNDDYIKIFYQLTESGVTTIIGDKFPSSNKMSIDGGSFITSSSTRRMNSGSHMIRFEIGTGIGERYFGTSSYFDGIAGHTVVIPNKVTTLNIKAFRNSAENIHTIVFGSGLTSIVTDCTTAVSTPNVNRLDFYGDIPTGFPAVCASGDLWTCSANGILVVPMGKLDAFSTAIEGSAFESWEVYERTE